MANTDESTNDLKALSDGGGDVKEKAVEWETGDEDERKGYEKGKSERKIRRDRKNKKGKKGKKKKKTKLPEPSEEIQELVNISEEVIPPVPSSSFDQLTMDVNFLVKEMEERNGIINYGTEYLRMFQNLHDVREDYSKLKARVRDLQDLRWKQVDEIGNLHALAEEQAKTIEAQKKELLEVRAIADAFCMREMACLEKSGKMRQELSEALREIEKCRSLRRDADVDEEEDLVKNLIRERDQIQDKMEILQERYNTVASMELEEHEQIAVFEEKVALLTKELGQERKEKHKERHKMMELEAEISKLKQNLNSTEQARKNAKEELNAVLDTVKNFQIVLEKREVAFEALEKKNLEEEHHLKVCQETLAKQRQVCGKLASDKVAAEDELKREKQITANLSKELDALTKELQKQGNEYNKKVLQISQLDEELKKAKSQIFKYDQQLKSVRLFETEQEMKIKDLNREKELLDVRCAKLAHALEESNAAIFRKDFDVKGLKKASKQEASKNVKLNIELTSLRRTKDRLNADLADLGLKLELETERAALERTSGDQTKKALRKAEAHLALAETEKDNVLMEKVRTLHQLNGERNNVLDLRANAKVLNHTLEQLSEEVKNRERDLYFEKKAHSKTEEERRHQESVANALRSTISDQKADIAKITVDLERSRVEHQIAVKQVDQVTREKQEVMNDREVLRTQLIRRNDELKVVRERVNILERLTTQGQLQYNQRIEDLKIMRTEILRLRTEGCNTGYTNQLPRLKKELYLTQMDFTKTQIWLRALDDEMKTPLNVHRWRKLEVTSPTLADLTTKVNILQKRLLTKTSELAQREDQLKEAHRLYLALREAKHREPETNERLLKTRLALNKRNRKVKALEAEMRIMLVELASQQREDKVGVRLSSSTGALPYIKKDSVCCFHDDQNIC